MPMPFQMKLRYDPDAAPKLMSYVSVWALLRYLMGT